MLIDKKIQDLQNVTKRKITYDDIAKIFNVSRSAIQNRVSRKQPLKDWEEQKLDEVFIANSMSDQKSLIKAEYFPESFGYFKDNEFYLSERREIIYIPAECFIEPVIKSEKYFVVNALGASMQPYILDGDKLIIRKIKEKEQVIDNRVYIFTFGNTIYVRRLVMNVNQLVVISDNKELCGFEPIVLKGSELKEVKILGQIVGLMRDCR